MRFGVCKEGNVVVDNKEQPQKVCKCYIWQITVIGGLQMVKGLLSSL
jgi:hypothetical protein